MLKLQFKERGTVPRKMILRHTEAKRIAFREIAEYYPTRLTPNASRGLTAELLVTRLDRGRISHLVRKLIGNRTRGESIDSWGKSTRSFGAV